MPYASNVLTIPEILEVSNRNKEPAMRVGALSYCTGVEQVFVATV